MKREKVFGESTEQLIKHFSRSLGIKYLNLIMSHLHLINTNSISHLPLHPDFLIAQNRRPIVVFSPGLYGFPEIYTSICELLASKGFVVVAVRHTDGSSVFLNHKGSVIYDFLPPPTGAETEFRKKQLQTRVDDIQETLKYISMGEVKEQMVVLLGHSFGGGTVAEATRLISNAVAGIALDAWMEPFGLTGEEMKSGWDWKHMKSKRFLFLNSELWQWESNLAKIHLIQRYTQRTWQVATLSGSMHHSFDDVAMWFGELLARYVLRLIGPLSHKRGIQCTIETISNFIENNTPVGRNLNDNDGPDQNHRHHRTSTSSSLPEEVVLTPAFLQQFPEIQI